MLTFTKNLFVLLLTFSIATVAPYAFADDTEEAPAAESVASESESVDDLIKQLDANRFSERQAATKKLTEIGHDAIEALSEAATGESREARTRAMDILKKHFEDGSGETKSAAKEALEKIAKGDHPSASRRAQDILKPKDDPAANDPFGGRIRIGGQGGIQIQPGNIQIQVQAIGGQNKRVQIKNVNGVKEIDVKEGNRRIKIHDDPNNGIKVEITEKKDGKEETKKYEAKNAEELKKNHPEAHKEYEKYSKNGGGIQVQGIQIQPGQAIPLPLQPNIRNLIPFPRNNKAKEIEEAIKRLEEIKKQLQDTSDEANDLKEIRDAFKKFQEEFQEIQKESANKGTNAKLEKAKAEAQSAAAKTMAKALEIAIKSDQEPEKRLEKIIEKQIQE